MRSAVHVGPAVGRFGAAVGVAFALTLAFVAASPAHAKTAIIYIEGRTQPLSGELVAETSDAVTILIAGIEHSVDRSRIRRVEYRLSVEEQYRQRRAELDEDDHKERYELARWLYRRQTADADALALEELGSLVEDAPEMEQAGLLRQLVEQRIAARREAEQQRDRGDDNGANDGPGDGGDQGQDPGEPEAERYLTQEQINLLKVMEIDLDDDPRIAVRRDVAREFLQAYGDDPALSDYQGEDGRARFLRLSGERMLRAMFNARARDFYGKVIVRTEPKPLQTFRQTWSRGLVAGYCGQCHNASEGGPGFKLYTGNPTSERAAYTNFLILHRTRVKGQPMINRDQPERSLLIQYALPRDEAELPHPEVERFRSFLRGESDPRFKRLAEWVGTLYPTASYAIDYTLPWAEGAERPGGATREGDEDRGGAGMEGNAGGE